MVRTWAPGVAPSFRILLNPRVPQIVFDECHKAKNAGSTKMGKAVLDLQNKLPLARVVYASATGGAVRIPCDPPAAVSFCLAVPAKGVSHTRAQPPSAPCSSSDTGAPLHLSQGHAGSPQAHGSNPAGPLVGRSQLSRPLTRPPGPPGLGS